MRFEGAAPQGDDVAKRKAYSDKFKAGALIMLESEGYPQDRYAMQRVAKRLNVPNRTLRQWAYTQNGEEFAELCQEQKKSLTTLIEDEIRAAFEALGMARPEAGYRDLTTSIAIFIDKMQLLSGKPTERSQQQINVSGLEHLAGMSDDELWTVIRPTTGVEAARH